MEPYSALHWECPSRHAARCRRSSAARRSCALRACFPRQNDCNCFCVPWSRRGGNCFKVRCWLCSASSSVNSGNSLPCCSSWRVDKPASPSRSGRRCYPDYLHCESFFAHFPLYFSVIRRLLYPLSPCRLHGRRGRSNTKHYFYYSSWPNFSTSAFSLWSDPSSPCSFFRSMSAN